jgi:hypothetical protein
MTFKCLAERACGFCVGSCVSLCMCDLQERGDVKTLSGSHGLHELQRSLGIAGITQ